MCVHLATLAFGLTALAFAQDLPRYDPATTRVALVPLVNVSGEKWEDLKLRQVEKGNAYLLEEFGKRGFQIVSRDTVEAEMARLKVDLADEEQQKRDTLYRIGRAVEADLVLCALVTDTDQRLKRFLEITDDELFCSLGDDILPNPADLARRLLDPILPSQREGKAKIKLWLLDVKREKPIISGKTAEGKSGGGYFAFFDKGSKRQVIAVANALRDLLKGFLKEYPAPRPR